uniref:Uncharacterized protein n=1 Tax=Solanum tuberosum TaxID=4113 RepID=M1DEP9_SOLTU
MGKVDIEDLDGEVLCKRLAKLSLEDSENDGSGSSQAVIPPSLSGAVHLFHPWWEGLIQGLKNGVSFEDVQMISYKGVGQSSMGFAYRFLPGQSEFVLKELEYSTEHLEKLSIYSNELGLSYITSQISPEVLLPSTSRRAGLHGLVNGVVEKVLTDVVTCGPGYFGIYLTLIIKGVGYTIWYKVDHSSMPDPSIFEAILNYELYFDPGYRFLSFNVVKFLETDDVALPMRKAINEKPLCELTISGSGPLLKG